MQTIRCYSVYSHRIHVCIRGQRATQVAAKSHKKVNGEITRANLEKEIALTQLHEGDAALSPDGKVYISVMTDGSWQKRMGRNSLFGVGAYYGVYTNKLLFCSTRVSRCAVSRKATAAVDCDTHHFF